MRMGRISRYTSTKENSFLTRFSSGSSVHMLSGLWSPFAAKPRLTLDSPEL